MRVGIEHLPVEPLPPSVLSLLRLRPGLEAPHPVSDVDAIPHPPERFDAEARDELAAILEREVARHEPHVAVLDAVRSLARPNASIVTTSGFAGLLLSPLEHLVHGLQAIRLARSLTQAWECPVVPVFWIEDDVHRAPEVDSTWMLNRHLDVQRVSLAGLGPGAEAPADRVLREEVHELAACRASIEQSLGAGAPFARLLDVLFPRAGETLTDAFARGLLELLGPHGLVVARARCLAEPFARALAPQMSAGLPARMRERRARLDPATARSSGPLLSWTGSHPPRPLEPGGEGWKHPDEPGSRNGDELAALLVQEPRSWSFGTPLTPFLLSQVAPVSAWLGTWGALEECLDVPWSEPACPAWVRSAELALIDEPGRASLEACGLSAIDALAGLPPAPKWAEDPAESGPAAALRRLSAQVRGELGDLRPGVEAVDPRMVPLLRRAARDAGDALEELAGKLERVDTNRQGTRARHRRRVENTLFPHGEPQARVLAPLHLLACFGTDWIEPLLDALPAVPRGPLVAHIDARGP